MLELCGARAVCASWKTTIFRMRAQFRDLTGLDRAAKIMGALRALVVGPLWRIPDRRSERFPVDNKGARSAYLSAHMRL